MPKGNFYPELCGYLVKLMDLSAGDDMKQLPEGETETCNMWLNHMQCYSIHVTLQGRGVTFEPLQSVNAGWIVIGRNICFPFQIQYKLHPVNRVLLRNVVGQTGNDCSSVLQGEAQREQ